MAHGWRGTIPAAAILALLALAVQLIIPPGYMPGAKRGGYLTLCDGHGPAMVGMAMSAIAAPNRPPAKSPSRDHPGAACPFAGHGLAPPLRAAPLLVSVAVNGGEPAIRTLADLTPGRGLAAPPPPPRGPPILL